MTKKIEAKRRDAGASRNKTLYQVVYQNLKQRIMNGEWQPDTKLTLRGVAAELGTSAQPVREAMNRLIAERVLVLKPNYSVSLPPTDKELIEELMSLRIVLEGEAARLCAPNLSKRDMLELDDALEEIIALHQPDRHSIEGCVQTAHRIPMLIAERAGFNFLKLEIENLRVRTAPYYAAGAAAMCNDEIFLRFAMTLQREFVNCLKRGNGEMARDICRTSIYTYQHFLYGVLGLE
ncbi:MAG: GntR family transcriptional regulator [Sphingobium sp.]